MRNVTHAIVGGIAGIGVLASAVQETGAASDTANATAEIIAAIAVTKTVDLDFASVVASGSADTVVVSPAGARTCGGSLTCTGTVAAASFDVTGGNNLTYSITLPASTVISAGGPTMTVNNFTSSPTPTGTLSGAGAETVTVGATLQVGASQAAGSYTGTFTLTVDYN